jgi:hypothetical protein
LPESIPPNSEGFMSDKTKLAETVRTACLEAALRAYEDAGISGLCEEGRWECAVQAIKGVDLTVLVKQPGSPDRNA